MKICDILKVKEILGKSLCTTSRNTPSAILVITGTERKIK